MYEYVHPNQIIFGATDVGTGWYAFYEPTEYRPIAQGSLTGTIYDGQRQWQFHERDGRLISNPGVRGEIICLTGVIIAIYDDEPSAENYLCVCYEADEEVLLVPKLPTTGNWREEGF